MSQEMGRTAEEERKELPIERGFPIEQVNDIAEKEGWGGARQWYRPIYTMHKWWARRLGSVFRAISLYTLLDDSDSASIYEPGENSEISDFGTDTSEITKLLSELSLENPDSLWDIYPKDVRVSDKKILDPFMGGGTSLIEASRFGAECHGRDLNPVAWFVTKKEVDTGSTDVDKLEEVYKEIESELSEKLQGYFKTPCPNHPDDHKADIMNSFWVKQLDCVSCGEIVSLFDDYRVGKGRYENSDQYNVFCPDCEQITLVDDWRSESECNECENTFAPQDGPASGSQYSCHDCGQKYSITDAIDEQNGFDLKYHSIEYYCPECDGRKDYDKPAVKGYRAATSFDLNLFEEAKEEWEQREELHDYVPDQDIPKGAMTVSSSINGNDVFRHGYEKWKDMFSKRQLLCYSLLLREIDEIDDKNLREYLLLSLSDSLRRNCMMIGYNYAGNQISNIFRNKAIDPPNRPVEGNVWGTDYGTCTFQTTWEMTKRGVEWGNSPTERYIEYPDSDDYPSTHRNPNIDSPDTIETKAFNQSVGQSTNVKQGSIFEIDAQDEYDAVITDPPYYDNVIYSELSDFFYVWQKILLEDEYDCFQEDRTPHNESIVANPFEKKGAAEFEDELAKSFSVIRNALKEDGVLTFTYHHSDSDSWGELLGSLCKADFEITATYPITADISKFVEGESVSFDIIVIARPTANRQPISWNSLRRNIYRTAQQTRKKLEQTRDLSQGDIGVIEMGECFHEYSKHHGKVMRAGEEMIAKEVVKEIYGIIQQGSDIGEIDVFLDLLETPDATYNDLNKLTRGTDASPEQMEDMRLYRIEGGEFILGTWDDEKRMAYIQERVNGDDEALNALDKAQFLRYRYEQGKSTQNYLSKWDVDDELRELCEGLADATGDDTYRRILGADSSLSEF